MAVGLWRYRFVTAAVHVLGFLSIVGAVVGAVWAGMLVPGGPEGSDYWFPVTLVMMGVGFWFPIFLMGLLLRWEGRAEHAGAVLNVRVVR